ncbi:FHA domain-containing protein [Rhizobium paknamense]|uniref:Type VI secretion system protein ImpI n=1 Tax=Rhizobium paknamense TaxID=1206817 RepID=A0ABU0I8M6_9HYPH|nr:FHA domain-containing protein [Rhizobium paknamense]MDQ0454588.1 type VI secretion system protein ImpI [Rhizobium paknamense]
MRLELKAEGNSRQIWVLEHGKRSIGRSRECDWQIEDAERRVSKLHCTISRDAKGFILTDQSANGTLVNGKLLLEGDSLRLDDGATIDIRGHRFRVRVSGEADRPAADPDPGLALSDENLTISAILSDIAPGGRVAKGILGERGGDEPWLADETKPKGKSLSRHVDIGWSGPPEIKGGSVVLPEDWFKEDLAPTKGDDETEAREEPRLSFQEVVSEAHVFEHRDARRTAVTVQPLRRRDGADEHDFDAVFADGPREEPPEPPPAATSRFPERLAEQVSEMEELLADCFGLLDLPSPANAGVRGHGEAALLSRLASLTEAQRSFNAMLEQALREATQRLDPRLLEARVDAAENRLSLIGRRNYWTAYKKEFEAEERLLSFRDFLRRAATGEEPSPAPVDGATPSIGGIHSHET